MSDTEKRFEKETEKHKLSNAMIEEQELRMQNALMLPYLLGLSAPVTQILDFLFLGSEENAKDPVFVFRNQIGYILNVAGEIKDAQHEGITTMRVLIEDIVVDHQHHTFEEAFKVIDKAMDARVGILVHCARGRSRSATITIGYLMSRHKWTLRQAFTYVKNKRPIIGPHQHLQNQLLVFEKHLIGRSTMTKVDFWL